MTAAYQRLQEREPFADARETFDEMAAHLKAPATMRAPHDEVEAYMVARSREMARRMLQAHLDLRAAAESAVAVRGSDGVARNERRRSHRSLKTLVGRVGVARLLYQAWGVDGLCPQDAALALPRDVYSMGVRRCVAEQACMGSFDTTAEHLAKTTATTVPKRQVEQLVRRAANDFCAFYEGKKATPAEEKGLLLVLTFDGAGVIMRTESLRPQTRRAAERAEEEPKHWPAKLGSGEKANRKRMAQVAAVYGIAPYVREPQDVLRDLRPLHAVGPRPPRPRPVNKRVWASVMRDPVDVVTEAFAEANKRDPEDTRTWLALVDGNATQIDLVRRAARRKGITVRIVLDLIHVLEYLWSAAYCFHAAGSDEAREWVTERVHALLCGADASDVAAGMRRSATLRRLERRGAVDECAAYLIKHRLFICYGEALQKGWPIATGVIEGACRHLVRARLDCSGARWSVEGAEAVLKLRSLRLSGDFDDYWQFHVAQEFHRNHTSLYAGNRPPDPMPRASLRTVK
jgi:hypothetical protein